jgi:hypothetical protein
MSYFTAIASIIALAYVIEVHLGSCSGVHNSEIGIASECDHPDRSSIRHFCTYVFPIVACPAGVAFLLRCLSAQ